jgi:hypothetical protein
LGFIDFGQHGAGRARIQANGAFGRKKAQRAQKGLTAKHTLVAPYLAKAENTRIHF